MSDLWLRSVERDMTRKLLGVRTATEVCWKCGAPICPECGLETFQCPDCDAFHCVGCGRYVDAPFEHRN